MLLDDRRQSAPALAIRRGALRLLRRHGFAAIPELVLPDGLRADLAGLDAKGSIWIVEIKSSLADFEADQKWHGYRSWCDRLFFAVHPDFPIERLPLETGMILADDYDGEVVREAPELRLTAHSRKAMTLLMARAAAARLHAALDPQGASL